MSAPPPPSASPPEQQQQQPQHASSARPVVLHIAEDAPSDAATAHAEAAPASAAGGTTDAASPSRSRALAASASSATAPLAPCPEEGCSWLSFTYLLWLNPLFALGAHKTLEESDVPAVRTDVSAAFVSALFREKWAEQLPRYMEEERSKAEQATAAAAAAAADGSKPSAASAGPATVNLSHDVGAKIGFSSYRLLFRTLSAMYGSRYWFCGILKCLNDGCNFAQPMLLSALVKHVADSQQADESKRPDASRGYLIAMGMMLLSITSLTMLNLFQRLTYGIGLRCRTALITAMYRKSFRLSPAARSQMSTGQIVSMMSVDATMVDQCAAWFHYGYSAAIQLVVAVALLIRALGYPALVGVGIMFFFVPMQATIMKGLRFARRSALKYTDQRIRQLNEILQGIRVIKSYAWEDSFMAGIVKLRMQEMHFVRSAGFIRGRNAVATQLGPILMAAGSFICLGATGGDLQASSVFSSVVLFNLLRMPLMQIPNVLNMIADAQIGLNRIQKFLLAEELTLLPERITTADADNECAKDREQINNGTADPALEAAYRALMGGAGVAASDAAAAAEGAAPVSAVAAAPVAPDTRFAIKIEHAEFSWDILPDQIVADDPAEIAAAASGGRGGRGGGRGGGGARGGRGGGRGKEAAEVGKGRGGASAGHGGRGGVRNGAGAAGKPLLSASDPQLALSDAVPDAPRVAPSVLHDISLVIPAGKLTLIVGAVGAGKSSLLCGLLGEMKRKAGTVKIVGSIGYCAQTAWIQNNNVKANILFGLPFDAERYAAVIRSCALTRDLRVLPDGDLTEIGEKGINLSGGQRQRVNLARAVYFDSDIVLMDDPLSAVDAHVSKYLFSECIQGALKGKTRVLVTHQLQYLPQSDHVVFLKDGRVREQGSFASLMAADAEFAQLFKTYGGGGAEEEKDAEIDAKDVAANAGEGSEDGTEKKQERADDAATKTAGAAPKAPARTLMTTEERAKGTVGFAVWRYYFRAFGGAPWVSLIILSISLQMSVRIFNDYWLAGWTDDRYDRPDTFYIAVYGALGGAQAIALFINVMLMVHRGTVAAKSIHDRSFMSLLRAPLSFFDTTPIGRILNRFSRDQDVIDNALADSLRMLSFLSFSILGTLVMMCFVQPFFALALGPILSLYYYFQMVYRRVNREIKRFDSTSRSPLFSHFAESLTGLPTIRAYQQQHPFILTNESRMDTNNRFYFLIAASQRWLGTRLEFLGGLIIFFTALIAASNAKSIRSGLVGLSLSYAMQVTTMMSFFLRQSVESENAMNSVERAKFYTEGIAHEKAASVPAADDQLISADLLSRSTSSSSSGKVWPSAGHISFQNVSMRYRPGLKLVLDSVSFEIAGGTRVGIVGRTGAGKSSLMVSLFRLVELSAGRIVIDGVDIAPLGLDKLRRSMAIIPQDPSLYSGTVRSNLDPFSEYSDEQIWDVLRKAHLSDRIDKLEGKLHAQVAEAGDNFSVGEKCLLCLSRAMLKNAKILIMDEATASVDMETDALIQHSLRTHFRHCTILTIAHRLATIMDYDQVMVLDFGAVREMDRPAALLRRGPGNSLFAALVAESGAQSADLLSRLAFESESLALSGGAGSAAALRQLEQSVWRDGRAMRESSVSRRRRRVPAEDAQQPGRHAAVEEEIDETSIVRFHELHEDSEGEDDGDEDAAAAAESSAAEDARLLGDVDAAPSPSGRSGDVHVQIGQ